MVETNKSKKAEALWQTLRLYSASSYDGLTFLLSILCDDFSILALAWPTLFHVPSWFKPWFTPIGLNLK